MPELNYALFRKLSRSEPALISVPAAQAPLSISTDTRTLRAGQVFWALRGEHFDGHEFVANALQNSAAFAVVEKGFPARPGQNLFFVRNSLAALQELAALYRDTFKIPLIALTGSNGKTTTKEMLAHLLGQLYPVYKTKGNLNNHIGCPLSLLETGRDDRAAVIELGTNHPGEIAVLADMVRPDHALVTNIGPAHLEFFGNEQGVFSEKTRLFESLAPAGKVYINVDDPWLAGWQKTGPERITFGFHGQPAVTGKISGLDEHGNAALTINNSRVIRLQVPGRHNAGNALAAAAVAINMGLTLNQIADGLETFCAPKQRSQLKEINGVLVLNDSYNANPASMQAAIDLAKSVSHPGKTWLLLGDMLELGATAQEAHRKLLANAVNGRTEILLRGSIFKSCLDEGPAQPGGLTWFASHETLAAYLNERLHPGDLILVKGSRGLQMEKIIEQIKYAG